MKYCCIHIHISHINTYWLSHHMLHLFWCAGYPGTNGTAMQAAELKLGGSSKLQRMYTALPILYFINCRPQWYLKALSVRKWCIPHIETNTLMNIDKYDYEYVSPYDTLKIIPYYHLKSCYHTAVSLEHSLIESDIDWTILLEKVWT